MPASDRLRRQQILREAEGYLDLVAAFADQWPLPTPVRDVVVQRALVALDRLSGRDAESAAALYLRGQALRAMERYGEAIAPLEQAARLEPANIEVFLALGWCYKRIGRVDLAIDALETAESTHDRAAIIHYNLACYWSLAKDGRRCAAHLSRALELEPAYRELIDGEHDFDPVRQDPDFQAVTSVIV